MPALLAMAVIAMSSCGGSPSPSTAMTPSTASPASTLDLSSLIEAEDAAIYAYGVIGAHLTGSARDQAVSALNVHRRLRDEWISLARSDGQKIPPAAIAYDLPIDVRDRATAEAMASHIEMRMIAVYESAGGIAVDALAKARARVASASTTG